MSRRNRTRAWFSQALVVSAIFATSGAEAGSARVDVELILAVDASDSMSRNEMLIQRDGYIAALRSPEVAAAIMSRGRVALAYMEWAGPRSQQIVVPWTILSEPEDGARFADRLAASPLKPGFDVPPWERGTAISEALKFAAGMFNAQGASRVVDISGDGPQNIGGDLFIVHDWLVAEGVVINGLPIVISPVPEWRTPLDVYYEDCVIGGPGAFTIAVNHPSLFEEAIRRKLVLEIAGPAVRLIHADYRPDARPPTDCAPFGQQPGQ
jgi:hypothetical protein